MFEQGLRARGRCCCGTGRMRVCMRPRSGDLRRRVVCVCVCVCVFDNFLCFLCVLPADFGVCVETVEICKIRDRY